MMMMMMMINICWTLTMCQVLFLGSRCTVNLFILLWSIFSLIYSWEIWLGCSLHGKEKKNFTFLLNAQCLSPLSFIFPCPYMRTPPMSCLTYFLFDYFIPSSYELIHSQSPLSRKTRTHRPDYCCTLFPSFPTSHGHHSAELDCHDRIISS